MLIPWSPDGNGKALHLLIVPTPGEGRVQGSIDKVVHLCILLAPSHCSSSGNRNFTFTGRSWCSWWRGEVPFSTCTLQGMQLYNNCSAKYHSSLYICHGGSRYFPLFIVAGYSTFCHSPNSTSWKLSMIEYFPFLFLPGNPAPIFLY